MPFQANTVVLPAGAAGMTAHENRLINGPAELLDARGVSFEDNHIRRERSSRLYDGTGGLKNRPGFIGDFSGSTPSLTKAGILAYYVGTGPISYVKNIGTASDSQASVTSITLNIPVPVAGVALNNRILVAVVVNDDFPTTISVTDTQGNLYLKRAERTGSGRYALFDANATTALTNVDTIDVAFTGLTSNPVPTNVAAVADEATGLRINSGALGGITSPLGYTSGTNVVLGPLPAATQDEIFLYAIVPSFYDDTDPDPTFTPKTGYLLSASVDSTAIATSADVGMHTNYRVDTDGGRIVAMTSWRSDEERTKTNGASTVTTASGSTTVTGTSTNFLTDTAPGDRIIVEGEERVVASIGSDTSLTTTAAWRHSNASKTYTIIEGERLVTVTTTGTMLKDKPLTTTTGDLDFWAPQGGLSLAHENGFFVVGGREAAANDRKLFFFNGIDPVQVLSGSGTTAAAISAPPLDWGSSQNPRNQPIGGTIHRFRLVGFGNMSDPHRIYLSDPDNHEDFTSSPESVRVRSDIGDRIYCALSFNGILFILKHPEGIFWLDDTNFDTTDWVIQSKSTAVGCAPTPYAALAIDDDILFMAQDGTFHLMSAVDALGGVKTSDLTYRLGLSTWIRQNINLSRLDLVQSVWDQRKKIAYFAVPKPGSTRRDRLLKWDFGAVLRDGPVRFSYSDRDTVDGITIRQDLADSINRPHIGEDDKTYTADLETPLPEKAGAPYTTTYQTPHTDFGWVDPSLMHRRKIFEFLELVFNNESVGSTSDVTVEVYVDQVLRQTLTFDATKTRDRKRLTVGDGHTFSVKITQSSLNTDFKILAHLVSFRVGNEDQSR